MAGLAGENLGDRGSLILRLVGEHRAGDRVTDRIDAVDVGLVVAVGLDAPALVERHADLLQAEAFDVRAAADRDEHDVGFEHLRAAVALGRRNADGKRPALLLNARHFRAETERQALLLEDALALLRHLAVEARKDAVEEFHDRHLRAEPPPHRSDLKSDHAGADDEEPLRHGFELKRSGRGDDALFVDLHTWKRRRFRAGRDHDRLRLDRLAAALRKRHLHLAGRRDARASVQEVDLVLLEEEGDTVDVRLNGRVLVRHHRGEIELRRADADAELGEAVPRLLEHLGRIEQRLGGDAADVQARAAQGRPLFDDGNLHAELRRLDCADIAARAGADDGQIVLSHDIPSRRARVGRKSNCSGDGAPTLRVDG